MSFRRSSSTSTIAPSVTGSSTSRTSSVKTSLSSSIQSHFLESILSIQGRPPRLPVQKRKDPLSLPTTTRNFRAFVQKSGPIFWFQDGVEATIMWEDWWWSSMWMGIWAVVAFHPYLLLCLPSLILTLILIQTHSARFPHIPAATYQSGASVPTPSEALYHSLNNPTSTGEGKVNPPVVPNPPHEGSIHYYENLRDIQNMMKMVTDGYDAIAPSVQYLNWSSYNRTLIILQLSILTTVLMFFLGPFIPIRPILLIAGEGVFILNHPWTLPALEGLSKSISTSKEGRKMKMQGKHLSAKLREWLEIDRLNDDVWQKGFKDFEMFQNERYLLDASARGKKELPQLNWSSHNLTFGERKPWTKGSDGWSSKELEVEGYSLDISKQVATALDPGWKWVDGDDWRIDWVGDWSSVGVDDEGYVYTDASWQRPSPYAYGHGGSNPSYPPSRIRKPKDHQTSWSTSSAASSIGGTETPFYDSDQGSEEEELEEKFPTAAVDGKRLIALTRRRRWLRRAVRIE